MADYDVIVIGGGHNGLTAAAYLARAGRRTLLLEARGEVGGSLANTTFGEHSAPLGFATVDNLYPGVVDDLGLTGHGLELSDGSGTLVLGDATEPLWLPANDPAASLSADDRAGLAELQRLLTLAGVAMKPILSGPLPTVEPTGIGDLFELLMAGWRLRSLGKRDMPDVMRLLPMTLRDITEEHVSDPRPRSTSATHACRRRSPAGHCMAPGWAHGRPVAASPCCITTHPGDHSCLARRVSPREAPRRWPPPSPLPRRRTVPRCARTRALPASESPRIERSV